MSIFTSVLFPAPLVASRAIALDPDAEKLPIGGAVSAGRGEIVEGIVGRLDDVIGDELRTFARRDFWVLQAALPFVDCPAREVVSRQLRKDRLEIELTVAKRAVTAGALEPSLVAAIDALLGGRIELAFLT